MGGTITFVAALEYFTANIEDFFLMNYLSAALIISWVLANKA